MIPRLVPAASALAPPLRPAYAFASSMLSTDPRERDVPWAVYAATRRRRPTDLPSLAPLLPTYLTRLSRSYRPIDHQRAVTIASDFANLWDMSSRPLTDADAPVVTDASPSSCPQCLCQSHAVLSNVDALEGISICIPRRQVVPNDEHLDNDDGHDGHDPGLDNNGNGRKQQHHPWISPPPRLMCAMQSQRIGEALVRHRILALSRLGHPAAALETFESVAAPWASLATADRRVHGRSPMALLAHRVRRDHGHHVLCSIMSAALVQQQLQKDARHFPVTADAIYERYRTSILATSTKAAHLAVLSHLRRRRPDTGNGGDVVAALHLMRSIPHSLYSAPLITSVMRELTRQRQGREALAMFDGILVPAMEAAAADAAAAPSEGANEDPDEDEAVPQMVPDTSAVTAAVQAELAMAFSSSPPNGRSGGDALAALGDDSNGAPLAIPMNDDVDEIDPALEEDHRPRNQGDPQLDPAAVHAAWDRAMHLFRSHMEFTPATRDLWSDDDRERYPPLPPGLRHLQPTARTYAALVHFALYAATSSLSDPANNDSMIWIQRAVTLHAEMTQSEHVPAAAASTHLLETLVRVSPTQPAAARMAALVAAAYVRAQGTPDGMLADALARCRRVPVSEAVVELADAAPTRDLADAWLAVEGRRGAPPAARTADDGESGVLVIDGNSHVRSDDPSYGDRISTSSTSESAARRQRRIRTMRRRPSMVWESAKVLDRRAIQEAEWAQLAVGDLPPSSSSRN
ncbi:hypothetical protein BC828DRAFT_391680 [Blastocladiella britannica]|nr:hypothetical protein BC828DRAFT_391680 [Blastocladiella britannica]